MKLSRNRAALLALLALVPSAAALQADDATCPACNRPYGPCAAQSPYIPRTDLQREREVESGVLPGQEIREASCPTGDCGRFECATCQSKAYYMKNP